MPLVSLDDLAERLKTTRNALHCRYRRSPSNLPPILKIPGDKRFFFDSYIVEEWIKNPAAFMPQPKRGPGRPRKTTKAS
jgi:hypothetical protein